MARTRALTRSSRVTMLPAWTRNGLAPSGGGRRLCHRPTHNVMDRGIIRDRRPDHGKTPPASPDSSCCDDCAAPAARRRDKKQRFFRVSPSQLTTQEPTRPNGNAKIGGESPSRDQELDTQGA